MYIVPGTGISTWLTTEKSGCSVWKKTASGPCVNGNGRQEEKEDRLERRAQAI